MHEQSFAPISRFQCALPWYTPCHRCWRNPARSRRIHRKRQGCDPGSRAMNGWLSALSPFF